jgi:dihydroxyacid dehydratase/phosphogluconate dehydratase
MGAASALWRATGMTAKDLGKSMGEVIAKWDITSPANEHALHFYRAGPAGIRPTKAFSQDCRSGDTDREGGGLAVLFGNIAGDNIAIDIPGRKIAVDISDEELNAKPWKPASRVRKVSLALKAYALLATSADKGAVRNAAILEDE